MKSVIVHNHPFDLYISEAQLKARVIEMGAEITKDYAGKNPMLIAILNGAFIFTADLMRACEMECEVGFVRLASYQGMSSSGEVNTLLGLDSSIRGRHLIIVEDIIDTGRTLYHFLSDLMQLEPASVALAALLVKPAAMQYSLTIKYSGFSIPNAFVIGYGLDYDGQGRNLRDIYQLAGA